MLQGAGLTAWGSMLPRHEHTLLLGQALLQCNCFAREWNMESPLQV